jgi:hypothetical protein
LCGIHVCDVNYNVLGKNHTNSKAVDGTRCQTIGRTLRTDLNDLLVSKTLPGYRSFSRSLSFAVISLGVDSTEAEEEAFAELNNDDGVFDGELWLLGMGTGARGGLAGFVMPSS